MLGKFSKQELIERRVEAVEEKCQRLYDAIMVLKSESEDEDKKLRRQMQCEHSHVEYRFSGLDYTKSCVQCGLTLGFVTPQQKAEEQLEAARDEVRRREKALNVTDKNASLQSILDHAKEMHKEGGMRSNGARYFSGGLRDTIESLEDYLSKRD